MRRLTLFLLILCTLAAGAKLKAVNIQQNRLDEIEREQMMQSTAIVLDIPLSDK